MPNDVQTTGAAPRSLIEHFVPGNATRDNIELSIVVPALNEEITVGEFIEWCQEGLVRAGVVGQVLIIDSSTDDTAKIVLEHGGEVLRGPDLRLSGIDPFRRGVSQRSGVCHGQPLSR